MLNKLIVIGRLGQSPKLAKTKNDKVICTFSVAVDSGFGEYKTTDWFNCSCFGAMAEACAKYLQKGSQVYLEGSIHMRTYKGKDGTEKSSMDYAVSDVKFLSKASKAQSQPQSPQPVPNDDYFQNDIPF